MSRKRWASISIPLLLLVLFRTGFAQPLEVAPLTDPRPLERPTPFAFVDTGDSARILPGIAGRFQTVRTGQQLVQTLPLSVAFRFRTARVGAGGSLTQTGTQGNSNNQHDDRNAMYHTESPFPPRVDHGRVHLPRQRAIPTTWTQATYHRGIPA